MYDPVLNQRPSDINEEQAEVYEQRRIRIDYFYPWECVSI